MVMSKIQDLIAKFEFWYARKFIKLDKHYTFFVDMNGEPGSFAIKYLKKYEGVIVEFNNVKIENNELKFDYDIISNLNNCNVKTAKFDRFTSHVMRNIILSAVENHKKEQDENGNFDFVESDTKRTVHEEVSSILEERVPDRKPRKKTVRRNKKLHSEVQQPSSDSST